MEEYDLLDIGVYSSLKNIEKNVPPQGAAKSLTMSDGVVGQLCFTKRYQMECPPRVCSSIIWYFAGGGRAPCCVATAVQQ